MISFIKNVMLGCRRPIPWWGLSFLDLWLSYWLFLKTLTIAYLWLFITKCGKKKIIFHFFPYFVFTSKPFVEWSWQFLWAFWFSGAQLPELPYPLGSYCQSASGRQVTNSTEASILLTNARKPEKNCKKLDFKATLTLWQRPRTLWKWSGSCLKTQQVINISVIWI